MKKYPKTAAFLLCAALATLTCAYAQDKPEIHGKADFVNNYVWRGLDQNSGFSVQPSLSISYKGFCFNAWGSESLTNGDGAREFDINLGYAYKGFSLTLSNLWWGGKHTPYGYYKGKERNVDNGHHLEATAAYCFGDNFPLTLSWSTWLAGSDASSNSFKRCYSTYICASYAIGLPYAITLTPTAGFTPWNSYYSQCCGKRKACFTDLSLKASKEIGITDRFSLPLFLQAIVNPSNDKDNVFFVAGFSLGF